MRFDNDEIRDSYALKYAERKSKAEGLYDNLANTLSLSPEQFAEALGGNFMGKMGKMYGNLIIKHNLWESAITLALHHNPKIAFRSAWALDNAYFSNREELPNHFPKLFIDTYLASENGSVHRCYTKILCDMLKRKLIHPEISTLEKIAEKTFDLLLNPDTKVAVKAWCVEVLYILSSKISWVDEHLEDTIRTQLEREPLSPATINHAKKTLIRLQKRKENRQ